MEDLIFYGTIVGVIYFIGTIIYVLKEINNIKK